MPDDAVSKSTAIRQLAREFVDDMELGRLNLEQTVLKALRLARLSGAVDQQAWLSYELVGYTDNTALAANYMRWSGRWTSEAMKLAWRDPLAAVDDALIAARLQMQTIRIPDVNASLSLSSSNPSEFVGGTYFDRRKTHDPSDSIKHVTQYADRLRTTITTLSNIRAKTLAMIYSFALNVHLEREFSSVTEAIFDQYKIEVDSLITANAGDVLQRIPSVWMRLGEGDREAVSHALSSCRRIIDAFADGIYPESDIPQAEFDADKDLKKGYTTRYRINQWIKRRSQSESQTKKLRQNLTNIYSRVTTGVHDDVAHAEARALFLGTYLLLGEVLTLPAPALPIADGSPTGVDPTPMPSDG